MQIVLVFKLVPDATFANTKTISASLDRDLKLIIKTVDRAMQTPNFIISSQDFHIESVKSVIDLKNSYISDIQTRIVSSYLGKFRQGRKLSSQNGSLPFKTVGLENIPQWNADTLLFFVLAAIALYIDYVRIGIEKAMLCSFLS